MSTRKFAAALGAVQIIILIAACGELDTVYPAGETYRVDALVNDLSLGDCSIIGENTLIYPYFISAVANDPDVRGLTVFLQSPGGTAIGARLRYTLDSGGAGSTGGAAQKDSSAPAGEGGQPQGGEEKRAAGDTSSGDSGLPAGLIRMGGADRLIPVARLDRDLPGFVLPGDLGIGRYVMVFQVQGERDALYRIERPFFFTAGADLFIGDIHPCLPGFSAGAPLIPSGAVIMMEAEIRADPRLEPYVVWYNGKKRIGEGFFRDGANRLMWKVPDQSGFHNVRAELFPFRPLQDTAGKIRELSLPVSSKQGNTGYFSASAGQFVHWYQFNGNLQDSRAAGREGDLLSPEGVPRWRGEAGIYGLALGPGDVYTVPDSSFPPLREEFGGGQFLLRFKPLAEGTIFRAVFISAAPPRDRLDLVLSYTGEAVQLILIRGTESYTVASCDSFDREEFLAATVGFNIRGGVFTASLKMEDTGMIPGEKSIFLPGIMAGEKTLQFGGPSPAEAAARAEDAPVLPESASSGITAILDEAALIYTPEDRNVQSFGDEGNTEDSYAAGQSADFEQA